MLFWAFREARMAGPRGTAATVRYIDAFRPDFRRGLSPADFITALGFEVSYPASLQRICSDTAQIKTNLHLSIPLLSGAMMIDISDGTTDHGSAVIVDMAVTIIRAIDPDPVAAMAELVKARGFIHEVFVDAMANFERASGIVR